MIWYLGEAQELLFAAVQLSQTRVARQTDKWRSLASWQRDCPRSATFRDPFRVLPLSVRLPAIFLEFPYGVHSNSDRNSLAMFIYF